MTAIEQTTKMATTVESVADAFVFVMAHLDRVGDAPSVVIKPFWRYDASGDGVRMFDVAVSGMVERPASVDGGTWLG